MREYRRIPFLRFVDASSVTTPAVTGLARRVSIA
jgi:hypothetical protein